MSAKSFIIPKENDLLDEDIKSKKHQYMEHVYVSFKRSLHQDSLPDKISIFQFKDSPLEVIIKKSSYIANLENLQDYYIKLEEYEICTVIKNLIKKINKKEDDNTNEPID